MQMCIRDRYHFIKSLSFQKDTLSSLTGHSAVTYIQGLHPQILAKLQIFMKMCIRDRSANSICKMSLSKTQFFLFFESGNYVKATRFFT